MTVALPLSWLPKITALNRYTDVAIPSDVSKDANMATIVQTIARCLSLIFLLAFDEQKSGKPVTGISWAKYEKTADCDYRWDHCSHENDFHA